MNETLIGILAGMGPRSTAPFVDLVINQCQIQYGAKYDDEFPPMLIYSLPAPFYSADPFDENRLKETISTGLKKLESTGANFIAMPCNAAHIYYDQLSSEIRVPLLNMIDETVATIATSSGKLALLATRLVMNAGIYQQRIQQTTTIYVASENWQSQVDQLIVAVKSSPDPSLPQQLWDQLVSEIVEAGVATILMACTDLSPLAQRKPSQLSIIDATECLAKAVVRRYRQA